MPIGERNLSAELGYDLDLNQYAIIYARYQHIDFTTTAAGSSFSDDIVHIGCACAGDTRLARAPLPLGVPKAGVFA